MKRAACIQKKRWDWPELRESQPKRQQGHVFVSRSRRANKHKTAAATHMHTHIPSVSTLLDPYPSLSGSRRRTIWISGPSLSLFPSPLHSLPFRFRLILAQQNQTSGRSCCRVARGGAWGNREGSHPISNVTGFLDQVDYTLRVITKNLK